MRSAIEVEESYQAYCTDPAVKTAVDHLLSSGGNSKKSALDLPDDIEWKDLRAFHRAVLSAHQVRCEFAVFLIDLWDSVWQPALKDSGVGSRLDECSVAEAEEHGKLDTNTVWSAKEYHRTFVVGGTNFQLGLSVWTSGKSVQLGFCLWDGDDSPGVNALDLGDGWPEQPAGDEWIYTTDDPALIVDGTIQLDALQDAAANALAAVSAHFQR